MSKQIESLSRDGLETFIVRFANNRVALACGKCGGHGNIPHFGYVDDGICFACEGSGIHTVRGDRKSYDSIDELVAAVLKSIKRTEASRKSRAKKEEAARLERVAAWEAARPEREAKEAAEAAEREAAYGKQTYLDGQVGDVVSFGGVVKFTKSFEGNYGPSLLVVVQQPSGSEVKFYSTAKFAWALDSGDEVNLVAEITGFGEYEGTKQTSVKKTKVAK
jgi:hypothetical protein